MGVGVRLPPWAQQTPASIVFVGVLFFLPEKGQTKDTEGWTDIQS